MKQTETSCEQYNVWDKYFLMKHQKSVTSVYKCIIQGKAMQPLYTSVTMKKMTPSLSETTVTSVYNVF